MKDKQLEKQTSIFGGGECVVCGAAVKPSLCGGEVVTLLWCSVECSRRYFQNALPPKQLLFIDEYLIDLNPTEAARRAGYKFSTRASEVAGGHQLLKKNTIKQALSLYMAERSARTQITADKVLTDIEAVKIDSMTKDKKTKAMVNAAAALKACELQGKHLKMFTEKLELDVSENLADRLQRAREREKGGGE